MSLDVAARFFGLGIIQENVHIKMYKSTFDLAYERGIAATLCGLHIARKSIAVLTYISLYVRTGDRSEIGRPGHYAIHFLTCERGVAACLFGLDVLLGFFTGLRLL